MNELIAEIDFDYDDDKKEFCKNPHGRNQRIVSFSAIESEGKDTVSLSFDLGRKDDDSITVSFEIKELLAKLGKAIFDHD